MTDRFRIRILIVFALACLWPVLAGAQEAPLVLTNLPGKTVGGFGNLPAKFVPGRNTGGVFVPGMKLGRQFVPGLHNLENKFVAGIYDEDGIFRAGTQGVTGFFEPEERTPGGELIKLPILKRDDIELAVTDIELIATFEEQSYFIQHLLGNVVTVTSPFGQFSGAWSVDEKNVYCREFDESPPMPDLAQRACYLIGYGKGRLHMYTEEYKPTGINYTVWE